MLRGHEAAIGERLMHDLEALMVLPDVPCDASEKISMRATSISMVRDRGNDYSVPVGCAHHEVQVRGYVGGDRGRCLAARGHAVGQSCATMVRRMAS